MNKEDIQRMISYCDKLLKEYRNILEDSRDFPNPNKKIAKMLWSMRVSDVPKLIRLCKLEKGILQRELSRFNDTSKGVLKSKPEVKEELKPWSMKPFDKFLYRSTKKGVWEIGFFGYREVSEFGDPDYNWDYFTVGGLDFGTEVLPYNDETKHLHRTMEPRVGNWALIPTILE